MQAANVLDSNVSPAANFFSPDELEALLLGACWAMEDEDDSMAEAASSAAEKLATMLPEPPPLELACPTPNSDDPSGSYWAPFLEAAADAERKLSLIYRDKTGSGTSRVIWPLMLDTWRNPAVIVAWCETRLDFRVFRVDRIQSLELLDRYPTRRQVLIAKWQLRDDDNQ